MFLYQSQDRSSCLTVSFVLCSCLVSFCRDAVWQIPLSWLPCQQKHHPLCHGSSLHWNQLDTCLNNSFSVYDAVLTLVSVDVLGFCFMSRRVGMCVYDNHSMAYGMFTSYSPSSAVSGIFFWLSTAAASIIAWILIFSAVPKRPPPVELWGGGVAVQNADQPGRITHLSSDRLALLLLSLH